MCLPVPGDKCVGADGNAQVLFTPSDQELALKLHNDKRRMVTDYY